ncbi:similar to THO2 [Actinidia rufa]|uniref:Similar to THO2 n=1 Tax=Actinidia rufa TaxID=165716 RepID=A0A7J0GXU2_9ERIC|nr:similar to THO2 [Actinidia rufa]
MSLPSVECVYVTEECVREWKNGNSIFKAPIPVPVLRFLYELCWTMVRGELPFQKCKAALESVEFLDEVLDEEMGSNFVDVVTQMSQDRVLNGMDLLFYSGGFGPIFSMGIAGPGGVGGGVSWGMIQIMAVQARLEDTFGLQLSSSGFV